MEFCFALETSKFVFKTAKLGEQLPGLVLCVFVCLTCPALISVDARIRFLDAFSKHVLAEEDSTGTGLPLPRCYGPADGFYFKIFIFIHECF